MAQTLTASQAYELILAIEQELDAALVRFEDRPEADREPGVSRAQYAIEQALEQIGRARRVLLVATRKQDC